MVNIRLGLTILGVALVATGCSRFIDNGSLDHKNTERLAPLTLPSDAQARPFTPLYPAPRIDAAAIQNTPDFVSKNGKRFELPRPKFETVITTPALATTVGSATLVEDGSRNPLLKIEGDAATVWRYTLATLTSLNVKFSSKSKSGYETEVDYEGKSFILRLNSIGNSNTLAAFDTNNNFIDAELASELLTQISQNWPA